MVAAVTEAASAPSARASSRTTFNVGTRRSALALWQADSVAASLRANHPSCTFDVRAMATMGDNNQTTALHKFNAKALWTHELEEQLVDGRLDLVVHSLKDMPTQLPEQCALGAVCSRAERRDCVVMSPASAANGWTTLADLPPGSTVGTSSVRRIAQVARLFPHLRTVDVRGNINTRVAKLDAEGGGYSALVLAATGLQRLGMGGRVSSFLGRAEDGWYGPVGQGALGIEVRNTDPEAASMCEGLMTADGRDGMRTWYECLAERMLLRTLEGGCSVPIGVDTEWKAEDELLLHAVVLSVDGQNVVQAEKRTRVGSKTEAEECGLALAGDLVFKGAGGILAEINLNRKIIAEGGGA